MPERIEDYEVLGIIGTGSFGTCYKVRKRNTSHVFVWKAVDYGSMSEERKKLLVSEVNLLRELRHPNIVRYYDRILHKESATIYIIMEWCVGGDLATMITKCKRNNTYLEEAFIWRALYQTSRALQACHSPGRPVLHRDIKPANLFLDSDFNIKLGDFGLARILTNAKDDDKEDENDSLYAQTVVGTPYYMSPEVVKGSKYNRKSDVWSLGCVIYELCSLTPPFSSGNIKSLTTRIKGGRFERIPSHYSNELQQMITFMLTVNHEIRPSIETILHHPSVVTHIATWSLTKTLYRSPKEESVPVKEPEVVLNETFCSCVGDCCANESPLSNAPCKMPKEVSTTNLDPNEAKLSQTEVEIQFHNRRHREMDGSVRLKGNVSARKGTDQESISSITEKMNLLRQREAKLRMRELSLEERERNVRKKEREAALASRLARETMGRACVYLNTCRDGRGSACSNITKITLRSRSPSEKTPSFPDADSSLDQEQGETSVMAATSTKLDPRYVNKPMWHGSITAPRRVTFSLKNYETHVDPSLIDNKKNTALLTEINGGKENALKSVPTSDTQAWLESKRQMHRKNVNSLGKENVVPTSRSVNKVSSKKSSLPHLFGKSGKTF
ncbi:hypothetical protein J437_LFUL002691 [Ladona fulva]|uniref:non-specific serine/threonine protein kinase n=1 Tax=Ladona fulva TaxID=123851 RepID=A0A8K0JYN9_LADFU|nr:hypothetical protein J437_LFUL002691 [Ladona fulva]